MSARPCLAQAVGGIGDSYFDFFLKYRAKGMQESAVLGCVNLKKEHVRWPENCSSARLPGVCSPLSAVAPRE